MMACNTNGIPMRSNSVVGNGGVAVTPQQFCLKWNDHSYNLVKTFSNMAMDQDFVDVTLACEGTSLKAHKVVLSACSNYFKELFLSNPCKHPIVILKDMKMEEVRAIIDFMYKGEVNVYQHQLAALLKTAEILKVKGLTDIKDDEEEEKENHEICDMGNKQQHEPINKTIVDNTDSHVNCIPQQQQQQQQQHFQQLQPQTIPLHQVQQQPQIHTVTQLPPPPPQAQLQSQVAPQIQTDVQTPIQTQLNLQQQQTTEQELTHQISVPQQTVQEQATAPRKKRRRRSKRSIEGSVDEGSGSEEGSESGSADEEMVSVDNSVSKRSKGSTPPLQGNSNLHQDGSNHSLHNRRRAPPALPPPSTVPQTIQAHRVNNNNEYGHLDDSSETWQEGEQISMSNPMGEVDEESNGIIDIKPIVSFDEGSVGGSINNSMSVPSENMLVSHIDYASLSPGSTGSTPSSGKICRCQHCGLTFTAYSSLRRHMQRHYADRERYICDICQKSYSRKDYLKEHKKLKHQT